MARISARITSRSCSIRYFRLVLLREIGVQPRDEPVHEGSMMRQVFQLKLVHLMALFILVYVGAEVTIGELLVSVSVSFGQCH